MSPDRRAIFLVGFMGSGKSTVGRVLSERLGWTFVDTDQRIQEREGKPIETIFDDSGEGYFRGLEEEVLDDIGGFSRQVVATGGGTFLRFANRRKMHQKGCTIWLDVPLETVRARLKTSTGRPLWDPADPLAQRALFERRRAAYALAGLRVEAAGDPVETLAERIRTKIQ